MAGKRGTGEIIRKTPPLLLTLHSAEAGTGSALEERKEIMKMNTQTTVGLEALDNASLVALLAVAQEKNMLVMVPAEFFKAVQAPVERRQGERRLASAPVPPAVSHELAATVEAVAAHPVVPRPARRNGKKRNVNGRAFRRARYISALRSNADLSKLELSDRRRQVLGIIHDAGHDGITTAEIKEVMAKQEKAQDPEEMHGTVTQVLHWLKTSAPKPLLKVEEDAGEDEAPIGDKRGKAKGRRRVH
jgi:hypothetical protein